MPLTSPTRPLRDLVRQEPAARRFFVAHAQSALGTGAACVALLLLAHDRFRSPWAVTLVLLADVAPPMVLAPILGAAADRWPRRGCAVTADGLRAIAFVGIALSGGFATMVGFAALAGLGNALFRPAVLAGLPNLVEDVHRPAATSLFGTLEDVGYTFGPLLAAGLLLVVPAEQVMIVNAATFALSALLLAGVRLDRPAVPEPTRDEPAGWSLVRAALDGLRATATMPGVRTLVVASSGVILCAGFFNVGEVLLATDELHAGGGGYALLVAVFGLGIAAGSSSGARGGSNAVLTRRYLAGLACCAIGFLGTGVAPSFAVALVTFAVCGVGNGLVLVHERLLLQALVPDEYRGRVFGLKDALACWAFAPGFVAAGALASFAGIRALFVLAGAGTVLVWWAAAYALRSPEPAAVPSVPQLVAAGLEVA